MSNYTTAPMLQPYRDIRVRIIVMDYNYSILDELSGIAENISLSNDSESDIRRTANMDIILDSGYTKTGVLNSMYFEAGNGYWFDKYISIEIGVKDNHNNDIVYYPQGTYLINEPSVTYDAVTNSLSFSAVDLMAKLTGLRAGNLQGVEHQIPVGAIITDVMRDILQEQGFYKCVLNTPETPYVPYDIKISSEGTTYELLTQLRDINPNWEIFFDVDGTFVFQKIPSGQIDGNPNYSPTTMASDKDWDKLLINYQISTSFEDVKNYVEVYGKTIEPTAIGTSSMLSPSIVQVQSNDVSLRDDTISFVLFTLGDTSQDPVKLDSEIMYVHFVGKDEFQVRDFCVPTIKYTNMAYILRVGKGAMRYCGYQQPMAIAWEDNPNSPFYVGDNNYQTSYDLITSTDDVIVSDQNLEISVNKMGEYLDYQTPTDELVVTSNLFSNMVRHVCVGGEYDNIYSNQLAVERAKYELYQRCRLHDTITIECVPIYYLDTNQMISITLPNEDELSYWLVKSINTDFSTSGTQSITAMKYYAEYPAN